MMSFCLLVVFVLPLFLIFNVGATLRCNNVLLRFLLFFVLLR